MSEASHNTRPLPGMATPPARQGPGPIAASAVATLDLAMRHRAGGVLPGEHRAAGVGTGTELAQLRPYEPGDDLRMLDPAASARTAVAHVRLQVPERALTTWLVLDVSASMAFGTAVRLKSDVLEGVAGVVSRLAVRRGGRVGALTFGGPTTRLLPPRGGRRSMAQVSKLLEEGVATDGVTPAEDLSGALKRLRRLARNPGLVVIVSDFRDEGDWKRTLHSVAVRHGVVAVEVRDPREGEIPNAGTLVLVDPETGRQVEADTASPVLRARFAEAEASRQAGVADRLRRAGASHIVLRTDSDWLRDLARALR
jgi:uncharacterized protein (DUF58 family)